MSDQPILPLRSCGYDGPSLSAYGVAYDPDDEVWSIHTLGTHQRLNFSAFDELVSTEFKRKIKRVFKVLAQTRNARTCGQALTDVRRSARIWYEHSGQPVECLNQEFFAAAHLASITFGTWRLVLAVWCELDDSLIETGTLEFVRGIRTSSSNDDAVRTWDPEAGPYRPAEDTAIRASLDDGFNSGAISLYNYALLRLFRGTGARPIQVISMKVCDFRERDGTFSLHIPMAKQRGFAERELFMPWKPISQGLANVLKLHIQENLKPRLQTNEDIHDAPLFPVKSGNLTAEAYRSHLNPRVVRKIYKEVFADLEIRSPITGDLINGNATRDRHTLLTMLAMDGCTAGEIAANAGHSDPTSCEVYVEASTDHFQRMESAVSDAFIPVADRFIGRVVPTEDSDDNTVKNPGAKILDRDMNGVGSCDVGGCNALEAGAAPFACYTCRKFRAWADAPHMQLLDYLEVEYQRLLDNGHQAVADTKIQTIVAISDLLEGIGLDGFGRSIII